ncbi:MAG TPA: hypothetical protein VGG16_16675 [Streptosporangiaceae bacterium]
MNEFLTECREKEGKSAEPFDLSLWGTSTPESAAGMFGPLAEAGATWWQEFHQRTAEAGPVFRRVECGPL